MAPRRTTLVGGTAVLPAGTLPDAIVVLDGDEVEAVGPRDMVGIPEDSAVLDVTGHVVVPGFIDLQVNGGFGADVTEDPDAVWQVAARLPEHGVTAFLPTLVSPTPDTIRSAQSTLATGPPAGWRGAVPLGWHLEGPFIAEERRGVHPVERLLAPDPGLAREWHPGTMIRLVTIAPELPGALEVVETLATAGIVVSLGHSAAGYDEGLAGIAAGARYATHLFNAMPPLHHREPGLGAAVLADPRVIVGVIPDGVHVHPALVDLVRRAIGPDRLSLVTDAIALLGLEDATGSLGGVAVERDGPAVRQVGDGRLAGSALRLDEAVRNVTAWAGELRVEDAVAPVTRVPAHLLGERFRGVLEAGARADLVVLDPGLGVVATLVGGEVVHGPWR